MRPWARRLLLVSVLAVAAVAAGSLTLFFLHRSGFIKGIVNRQLQTALPFPAFVEDAWIDFWGPSVEIKDFQLLHEKSSTPIARIERGSIDLRLNPFAGSVFRLKRITVESGSADIPHSLLQNLQSPRGKPGIPSIPEIWVRKLSVQIEPVAGKKLFLGELSFAFSPMPEGGGNLRGKVLLPVGPELAVSGRMDENGRGSFVAAGDLRFEPRNTPETEGPQSLWADLRLLGDLSLRVQGSFGASGDPGLRIQIDGVAKDLVTSVPSTPFRVQKIDGSFSLGNLKESRFDLRGVWEQSNLFAIGKAQLMHPEAVVLDAFVAAQDLPLDERVRLHARKEPTVHDILDALEPQGRVDLSVHLVKQAQGTLKAEPVLRLKGIDATFHGFPEKEGSQPVGFPAKITQLRGEVLCQPGRISLHQLRGRLGDAEMAISGSLFHNQESHGEKIGIDLQLDVGKFAFDSSMREAARRLPPEIGKVWDDLRLGGHADLSLRLTKEPGPKKLRLSGKVVPQLASAQLREFPLPLEELSGEIVLDPERIVANLKGKSGSGDVAVQLGLLELRRSVAPALPPLHVQIQAARVPIDASLAKALDVAAPGIVEAIRPRSGTVQAKALLARMPDPNSPAGTTFFEQRVDARFEHAAVEPIWFPLAVDSASGTLLFANDSRSQRHLLLQGLEAKALGAPVLFDYAATAADNAAPASFETRLRVFGIPLVPDLFRAMEKASLPGAKVWSQPEWSGAVDLAWEQKRNRDLASTSRLAISFPGVGFRLPAEGLQVEEITGTIEAQGEKVTADRISAKLGTAAIEIRDLRSSILSEIPTIDFLLSIFRLDLGQDLERALPPVLASRAKAFGVEGKASIEDFSVSVALPLASPPLVRMQGPVQLRDFSTQGGVPVQEANLQIFIEEGILQGETLAIQGRVQEGSASILRRKLEKLRMRFDMRDQSLRLYEASGVAYRGNISQGTSDDFLQVDLVAPYAFRADLRIDDLNMRHLLRDLLPRAKNLQGSLGLTLQVRGESADLRTLEGQGELRIKDGALWEVPGFRELFRTFWSRNPPLFTEGRVRFRIQDRKFSLDAQDAAPIPFELSSRVLTLTAQKGTLDFTGDVDMTLRVKSILGIPIIGDLIGAIINFVADFRLSGPIANPQVNATAVEGEPLKKMLFVPETLADPRHIRL